MVQKSTFELVCEKYKQAQAEELKETKKEEKKLTHPEDLESEPPPPSEKNSKPLWKLKKKYSLEKI